MIDQNFRANQEKIKKDNFDKKAFQRAMAEKTLQDNRNLNESRTQGVSLLMHREKSQDEEFIKNTNEAHKQYLTEQLLKKRSD